jgi:hypothetical protein
MKLNGILFGSLDIVTIDVFRVNALLLSLCKSDVECTLLVTWQEGVSAHCTKH